MSKNYKAFLFDLNGTLVDDMHYHIRAWHRILNELGADISVEQTKAECYGKNQELLERIFPGRFTPEEKNTLSLEKEKQYQREFAPDLKGIAGLDEFLSRARKAGIKMAIGSAAIMFNIDFVLDGLNIRTCFDSLVSADHVRNSKPDPETYLKAASALGIPPADCLVFEDAPTGVEAARRSGMDCAVLTTMHQPNEFNHPNIIGFARDYNSLKGVLV